MTLLTICQNAADDIGIDRPATIVGNSNAAAKQLYAAARKSLLSLGRCHPWQVLVKEGTISLTSGTSTYALPNDFLEMRPNTMWDRVNDRESLMSIGSREWAFLKGREVVSTLNRQMRIIGNEFVFYETPTTTASDVMAYEYITKNFVTGNNATWTADSDTSVLDEWLIELAVVWRYKQRRETPGWEEDRAFYNKELEKAKSKDDAPQALRLGGPGPYLIGSAMTNESGYG